MMLSLNDFLKAKVEFNISQWFDVPHMQVYLRRGRRYIEDNEQTVLEIANVTVQTRHRGKGVLKQFLIDIAKQSNDEYLYVENVVVPGLARHLENNGWTRYPLLPHDFCYYRKRMP